ncbi:Aldo/keto reductase [Gloeophyllum trabeum ATCC 11539]|uniref:Aldo/keto reductase n=1 Tax=Gloeophyllum trabeum (strain ATCC 11539 / FP-39264 / Madison 617) TaxID=670483 RepID=S7Q9U9_GLOTA|nr:Aldo/keto reductase [Gloeophyllum trabeum ATCC 11539]EPQ56691.1 Aldo/keto reductase [Gloeophyllum trabeum ATCC 11539]
MPRLGFGVYASAKSICKRSVTCALHAGYRHIDSAMYYENEKEVGLAIQASVIPRHDVFVTTKILAPPPDDPTGGKLWAMLNEAVDRFDYVDLFLIHTPTSGPEGRIKLWKALEKLKQSGRARSIGVSNFGINHLQELAASSSTRPAVNQIELHPWCQQRDIVNYCQNHGITVQAYCPLVRGQKFEDPTLNQLVYVHLKDPAQILLRWSLQKGFVPLPKSDTPSRIEANAALYDFELSAEQMALLDSLDRGAKGAIDINPVNCP